MMSKTLYDTDEFIANSNIIEERFPNITSELLELLKDVDNNNPETFSDYYVNQYQRHKKKNPLLAFDYLIEGLSNKYLSFDKNSSVLLLKVILESSCSHTFDQEDLKWDNVFRSSWWKSKDDQRKAAFFILRIMVEGLEDIIDIPNSRLKVTELLFYLLPDVAKKLKVNKKEQTFEQLKSWKDFGKDITKAWEDFDPKQISMYEELKPIFNRFFSRLKKDYTYFIHFEGFNLFPNNIIDSIKSFDQYIEEGNITTAELEIETMVSLFKKTNDKDSLYVRQYVLPLIIESIDYFNRRIVSVNKPARLKIEPLDRKYAFFDEKASINLRFQLTNDGGGYAYNVKLDFEFDPHIVADNNPDSKYSMYWSQLSPGFIKLDIPVNLIEPFKDNLTGIYELTWRDWKKEYEPSEEILEFQCEEKEVDWDSLDASQRYSTAPVDIEEDYIGKKNRVLPIRSNVGQNSGSAWVLGQRRIGKTSTVLGVQRDLEESGEFLVVYTTYGQFSHDQPKTMIDQLVKRLTTLLSKKASINPDAIKVDYNGSLAPLFDFIDSLHQHTNKKIYFIIDEIDELPSLFYNVNNISQPFWQTLRSISISSISGFLLVGGENVAKLKTVWGGSLNLLRTFAADTFSEKEWSEYKTLVTKPVAEELFFTDEAVQKLYTSTYGNPFFTKLLCSSIQKNACVTHNSYISEMEIEQAMSDALTGELQMDHFQHFIEDGLKGEETEIKTRMRDRAKFLFSVIQTSLGRNDSLLQISDVKQEGINHDIHNDLFDDLLYEFQARNIIQLSDGKLSFTMPLFYWFISNRGEIELPKLFREEEKIIKQKKLEEKIRVKSEELKELAYEWGTYQEKRIEPSIIQQWLSQFGNINTQRDIFEFLKQINFIKRDDIIEELKYCLSLATKEMVFEKKTEHRKRHDIFVTYLGGPGKSGSWVANQFRAVNQIVKTNLIEFSTVVKIAEKNQVVFDDMKVLIIADDFACTGNSLCEYLEINKNSLSTMATEFNVRILLFVAFGFEDALDSIIKKIEDLNLKVDVHFGKQFGEEERIFSGKSRYFSSEDKKRDMEVILVEHFGHKVDKSRPKGYNDSEVAIVFPENCPNNSLPVFWKSKADWTPLFRRIVG